MTKSIVFFRFGYVQKGQLERQNRNKFLVYPIFQIIIINNVVKSM